RRPCRRASSRDAFNAGELETSTPIFHTFPACSVPAARATDASKSTTTPTTLTMFFIHDVLDIYWSPPLHSLKIEIKGFRFSPWLIRLGRSLMPRAYCLI